MFSLSHSPPPQTRDWFEKIADDYIDKNNASLQDTTSDAGGGRALSKALPAAAKDEFLLSIAEELSSLTIEDCIVDVGKDVTFKTIEEQNVHFSQKMREMARYDRDEEGGWSLLTRLEAEEIDVYERKVTWSNTVQLRSRCTVPQHGVDEVGHFIRDSDRDDNVRGQELATHQNKNIRRMGSDGTTTVFEQESELAWIRICYKVVRMPWPLSLRDLAYVSGYLWTKRNVATQQRYFVG